MRRPRFEPAPYRTPVHSDHARPVLYGTEGKPSAPAKVPTSQYRRSDETKPCDRAARLITSDRSYQTDSGKAWNGAKAAMLGTRVWRGDPSSHRSIPSHSPCLLTGIVSSRVQSAIGGRRKVNMIERAHANSLILMGPNGKGPNPLLLRRFQTTSAEVPIAGGSVASSNGFEAHTVWFHNGAGQSCIRLWLPDSRTSIPRSDWPPRCRA